MLYYNAFVCYYCNKSYKCIVASIVQESDGITTVGMGNSCNTEDTQPQNVSMTTIKLNSANTSGQDPVLLQLTAYRSIREN